MTPIERRTWLSRTLLHAAVLTGLIFATYVFLIAAPFKGSMAFDVVSYWRLDLAQPYHGTVGDLGFFPYSPAIAMLFAPFAGLPWLAFATLWYGVLLGALAWMGRRHVLLLLAFPPVAIDLYHGNIQLLIGAAIVLGMRFPAAWSFVLLTKLTPGIGLLWYVVRREWRPLAIALTTTAAIFAVTFVALPTQWMTWISIVINGAGTPPPWPALPIPIWLRLPVAAAIIIWGARRDALWTVPLAAALSVPALWPGAFSIVAAAWPLSRRSPSEKPTPGDTAREAEPETAHEDARGYHAPDAAQRRGEPGQAEPVSA